MMFASLNVESETGVGDFPIVNEFIDVFPDEITALQPEKKVKFAIDLVPGTSPISMMSYQMFALELNDRWDSLNS